MRVLLVAQLPTLLLAATVGVWLFYVQHQYEDVYWARRPDWDPMKAALEGSSYYKLPRVLQWFTANIGLHHIHHVQPRVPFYGLRGCQATIPAFQAVPPLTFSPQPALAAAAAGGRNRTAHGDVVGGGSP